MIHKSIKIQVNGSDERTHLDTYILGDYLDEAPNARKPLVLICPGGAYRMTSNREAEPVALQFNSIGYHAAILRYSCAPACLLYTSPSPRDRTRSRMPSSA